jgi:hypothetical protein
VEERSDGVVVDASQQPWREHDPNEQSCVGSTVDDPKEGRGLGQLLITTGLITGLTTGLTTGRVAPVPMSLQFQLS